MPNLPASELILNSDGSIYHLNLLPEDLAHTIILVGDPNRVPIVSKYFDQIEIQKSNREYVTHTGYIGNLRLSVIGTGIGAGNIDIVINECDALANIDFKKREVKNNITKLKFIRIGTCGGLQKNSLVDSFIISDYAIGLDGLMQYYQQANNQNEIALLKICREYFSSTFIANQIYATAGSENLTALFKTEKIGISGITMTCPGFYAPQHRVLRAKPSDVDLFSIAQKIKFQDLCVTNFEMETAAIYGLSRALNHDACSISLVVANRITKEFSTQMNSKIDELIKAVLEKLV